jgi:hypothetical protein
MSAVRLGGRWAAVGCILFSACSRPRLSPDAAPSIGAEVPPATSTADAPAHLIRTGMDIAPFLAAGCIEWGEGLLCTPGCIEAGGRGEGLLSR